MRTGQLIYHDPSGDMQTYDIDPGQLTLGRSDECDIHIDHPCVSRLHAVIACRYGRYSITDANSTNGTLVNGAPIYAETPLAHEDEITVGAAELRFTLLDPNGTLVGQPITLPALVVDEETRTITAHGAPVKLSPLEYELLRYLADRAGAVCTREECFLAAWGAPYEQATCEDALNACVSKLRRHLRGAAEAAGADPIQISVAPRVGFRLDARAEIIRRQEPPLIEASDLSAL